MCIRDRAKAPTGIYHGTSSGKTSWYGFTQEIVRSLGRNPAMVVPVATADFPRPAPRPAFSVLGHRALEAIGVAPIGQWDSRWKVAAGEVLADFR